MSPERRECQAEYEEEKTNTGRKHNGFGFPCGLDTCVGRVESGSQKEKVNLYFCVEKQRTNNQLKCVNVFEGWTQYGWSTQRKFQKPLGLSAQTQNPIAPCRPILAEANMLGPHTLYCSTDFVFELVVSPLSNIVAVG